MFKLDFFLQNVASTSSEQEQSKDQLPVDVGETRNGSSVSLINETALTVDSGGKRFE